MIGRSEWWEETKGARMSDCLVFLPFLNEAESVSQLVSKSVCQSLFLAGLWYSLRCSSTVTNKMSSTTWNISGSGAWRLSSVLTSTVWLTSLDILNLNDTFRASLSLLPHFNYRKPLSLSWLFIDQCLFFSCSLPCLSSLACLLSVCCFLRQSHSSLISGHCPSL